MTLNITIPENINDTKPKISVIGIGGAGGNAVNTMINENINNIEFIAANTDGQALSRSLTPRQIQLGKNTTLGLGAGSDAETGRKAAEESIEEIISELGDVNMLFLTTGMGGGTGSGAAPVIAKAARDRGILTVAVVTKPFDFEGKKRMEVAENGLALLKDHVDTLIVIPNQNLFKIANEKTTFAEAFKMADDVLYQGVCGITNLITNPGMINLDFADIKTVMGNMGKAMMGTGESSGEQRAINAAQEALNNPLLDDSNIKGAKSILLNIQGGPDMALFEVDEAASKIRNEVDENANIIFGSSIDNSLEGVIKVSVVATGIDDIKKDTEIHPTKLDVESTKILEPKTYKTDDIEVDLENIKTQEYLDIPVKDQSQIDIENQINQLDENNNFSDDEIDHINVLHKDNLSSDESNEEFDKVLSQKPNNQFTVAKPKTLFNRFSSFFINEKNDEVKLEPSLSIENVSSVEKKILDPDINFDHQNSKEKLSKTDNLDLFDDKNKIILEDHQINLTEIEQDTKEIDEKVLEIPAFLRRQAN
tara:strand:+ start:53 stop:1660 length:1608 start_codon:yes stop_codon:yes gene_type:complete